MVSIWIKMERGILDTLLIIIIVRNRKKNQNSMLPENKATINIELEKILYKKSIKLV